MTLELTMLAAAVWLPFVLPIGIWVAWNDMARMKIPNVAVMTLIVVFVVTGPFVLPLTDYLWRYLHLAVVLVAGFLLNMVRAMGAGDAKFGAAMAPFVALEDVTDFVFLLTAVLIAAFVTHRSARALPAVRAAAPGWESWQRRDFPMGLALGTALVLYLVIGVLQAV